MIAMLLAHGSVLILLHSFPNNTAYIPYLAIFLFNTMMLDHNPLLCSDTDSGSLLSHLGQQRSFAFRLGPQAHVEMSQPHHEV